MTFEEFAELVKIHSKPGLAEVDGGHVIQVWEDGEITSQKSGYLLNQRTLHQMESGIPIPIQNFLGTNVKMVDLAKHFPEKCGEHGFIYTDNIGAFTIRKAVYEIVIAYLQTGQKACEEMLRMAQERVEVQ